MANQNVYDNSIWLIGSASLDKSLLATETAKKLKMPVIYLNLLPNAPHSIKDLDDRIENHTKMIAELKKQISRSTDESVKKVLTVTLEKELGLRWEAKQQKEMRKLLPDVPTYEEMGYNPSVAQTIKQKIGKVAWHFYNKQFDIKLMQYVVEQLQVPCVIECPPGMCVSLDDEYLKLSQQFVQRNSGVFHKYFDESISFDNIQKILQPFNKVVKIKVVIPAAYKSSRITHDELNQLYINSGQYNMLATHTVTIGNVVRHKNPDWQKVDGAVAQIVDVYKTSTLPKK